MIAVLLLTLVAGQLANQPTKTFQPFHYKILQTSSSSLIMDNQCASCSIFSSRQQKQGICSQQQQYYIEKQHGFIIEANKPFTVHVNTDIENIVTSNGIGRSIVYNNTLGYRSQIIILSRCRRDEISTFQFNIMFHITPQNMTEIEVPLAASIECLSQISSTRMEYVILKFLGSALFVICSVTFTKFMFMNFKADANLAIMLCFSWIHPLISTVLNTLLVMRILFGLCNFQGLGPRKKALLVTISSIAFITCIKIVEESAPSVHLLLNIFTLVGIITIIRIARLRHIFFVWFVVLLTYGSWESSTTDHSDFQTYFPAIFTNRKYVCIEQNIMELALPITFSLFFTRFSKQHSQTKNIYLMFHFIFYLGMGTYTSIIQMKGASVDSGLPWILTGIIFSSFMIAAAEGNLRKLIQYRVFV